MGVRTLKILIGPRWLPNKAKSYVKEEIWPRRLLLLNISKARSSIYCEV